jgi:hypothetical protein
MTQHRISLAAALAPLSLVAVLATGAPAAAQSPAALPTAPGADRAVNGGLSQAHASLPGGPGLSPLEPYLVTWLLPASGLLTVAAGIFVDRQVRQRGMRRR